MDIGVRLEVRIGRNLGENYENNKEKNPHRYHESVAKHQKSNEQNL